MNLGENIYRLRKAKNLSQEELAQALDVSRQSVSKWETGAAIPELDKLMKMAQLFGISLDALVGNAAAEAPLPPPTGEKQTIPLRQILGIILFGFTLFLLLGSFFAPRIGISLICCFGLLSFALLLFHSNAACIICVLCSAVSFYLWLHGATSSFFLIFFLFSLPISIVWAGFRLSGLWKNENK